MRKIKVGVLGFGNMGELHSKNCLLMQSVDVAVADKSKSALHRAREIGAKEVYADYEDLIDKANVDAVVITLPNSLHKESICLAAENGINIFVEKPLGRTAEECEDILSCIVKNHVKLMVGFHQRFVDRNQNAKLMIEKGALGDIQLVAYESMGSGPFSHRVPPSPVPEWWFDAKSVGGGALLDTGCHAIDLTCWLLNDEASVKYVSLGYRLRLPMEDTSILSLQFKTTGATAILMIGWFTMIGRSTRRMDLHGTAGSISLEEPAAINTKQAVTEASKNVIRRFLGKRIAPYSMSETSRAYYKELEHFMDCIRKDKEPLVTGEDGLECARVIDQAYRLWNSANATKSD